MPSPKGVLCLASFPMPAVLQVSSWCEISQLVDCQTKRSGAKHGGSNPRWGKGFLLPKSDFSAYSVTLFVQPNAQSQASASV